MTSHERLIKAVQNSIENLFSDTTVSGSETRDDLQGIIDDCKMKIQASQEDEDQS